MSYIFIGVPLVLYLCQSVVFLTQGRWGMALCFAAYSLANAGILMDAVSRLSSKS